MRAVVGVARIAPAGSFSHVQADAPGLQEAVNDDACLGSS
jgi:hypothetical protein